MKFSTDINSSFSQFPDFPVLLLLFLTFFQLLFPELLLLPATLRGLEGLVLAAVLVHLGTLLKDLWQLVVPR